MIGNETLSTRRELLRGRLDKNLKKRIIRTLIQSLVGCGSEAWTIRTEDIKRIEAFEMWTLGSTEKIDWTGHIINEKVIVMIGERTRRQTIRKRKRNGSNTC